MSYLSTGSLVNIENTFEIGEILKQNGWTLLTGINTIIFTLLHFPCSTTLMSIKKESGNIKWALLAFTLPTIFGIIICMITSRIWNLIFFGCVDFPFSKLSIHIPLFLSVLDCFVVIFFFSQCSLYVTCMNTFYVMNISNIFSGDT